VTRIRITVKAGDTSIIREGSGAGEAHSSSPGLAHELAAKAAETDATKRALMTFGNAFGLSLYAGAPETTANRGGNRNRFEADKQEQRAVPAQINRLSGASSRKDAKHPRPCSTSRSNTDTKLSAWPAIDPLEEAAQLARGKIDKSALTIGEPRRLRNLYHLRRVAARPCLVCGRNRTQAHHLKYLQPNAMGRKVSDEYTVPLCSTHHRELHAAGTEKSWWQSQGIDPEPAAKQHWKDSLNSKLQTTVQS
jgi:hypothetical protein